ncbi:hypothetical protein NUACC21_21490 [Scytonema sp. NUACC21]
MPNTSKPVQLENAIVASAKPGTYLPNVLPEWMNKLGFIPRDIIVSSNRIGTKSTTNKTDVIIKLKNSPSLKISAKLSNADYFGNWYGHKRFVEEFGDNAFVKMTAKVTSWANDWAYSPNANLFVGVSICFGYRTGNTAIPFLEVFNNVAELIKIVAGFGEGEGTANCLYISDEQPSTVRDLIDKLLPIDSQAIVAQSEKIKVICRPVNPMTERSNRGKNVYTKFHPHERLPNLITVQKLKDLMTLGKFTEIEPNKINHNHILKTLKEDYNIEIPCK